MTMPDFSDLSFADNADQRCPVVLILDCSDSMLEVRPGETRSPLEALNGGLDVLVTELHKDPIAKRRVEVSIVAFGTEVAQPTDFATVDNLILPTLAASGVTSMGRAVEVALDAIENRKASYKANGIPYTRPMVFLIGDGLATDDLGPARAKLREAISQKKLSFFPVAVEGADVDQMSSLSDTQAIKLDGVKFSEFFQWLSASQTAVSASNPGDKVALPSPAGWATFEA